MDSNAYTMRCSNKRMYTKISELMDIIMNTSETVRVNASFPKDAAVLAEMTMMASLSMKCNHYPTKRTHVMSFERPIPTAIPSYVEQMEMSMSANSKPIQNVSVRQNQVTASIISDCISIYEFMERFRDMNKTEGTIVLASYPSLTHAATIAYVFECVSSYMKWDGVVSMVIITDEETRTAMHVYVGPRMNVTLLECTDKIMGLRQAMGSYADTYMTVITHDYTTMLMLANMKSGMNMDFSALVPVQTIVVESKLRQICTESNMLMETSPCSCPEENQIRIVPVQQVRDPAETTVMRRRVDMPIFGYLRWYTVMIRRAKIDTTCYDCSIALKLAYSVLYLMSGTKMDMSEMEESMWAENFRTYINTQDLLL